MFRPMIEPLEHRELPAGSVLAYITGGNLYVVGSSGNDSITVTQNNNQISVAGTSIGTNTGYVPSVSTSSFAKLYIYGMGGNDNINFSTVKVDTTVYTGTGNDVIRCGTGNDTVYNGGGFNTIDRPYNPSAPIIGGLSVSDIDQGSAPLCQTMSALAEAVQEGYNFANDITYLGNNYYQVKLHGLPTQRVLYDGWTTSNDPAPTRTGEFWTILMQRARLQAYGINPNQNYTTAQWNTFNTNTGGKLYSIGQAIADFTGCASTMNNVASLTPQQLQAALAAKQYVIAQSRQVNNYLSSDGIVGNHAYAVMKVYYQGGMWKVQLYNPWGVDSLNGRTIDSLDTSKSASNDGYITLSWQQFTSSANFANLFIGKVI
jgi:Calpain family cysteine protease/RTX calcium-binding nonapeptide repeat (4 copies)